MQLQYIERPFDIKGVEDSGIFEGFGSVFGNVDAYKEIVAPGAFAASLGEWKASGRLPPVLWQHRSYEPLGPHLDMEEQPVGLWLKGQLLQEVQRANEARALMKAKAVNGLSIGFVTREDSYDKVTGIRTLKRVDLWEVSVVTFPANPAAQISSVKSAIDAIGTVRDAEAFLRDVGRLTNTQAAAFISRFKSLSGQRESDQLDELKSAIQRNTSLFTPS